MRACVCVQFRFCKILNHSHTQSVSLCIYCSVLLYFTPTLTLLRSFTFLLNRVKYFSLLHSFAHCSSFTQLHFLMLLSVWSCVWEPNEAVFFHWTISGNVTILIGWMTSLPGLNHIWQKFSCFPEQHVWTCAIVSYKCPDRNFAVKYWALYTY